MAVDPEVGATGLVEAPLGGLPVVDAHHHLCDLSGQSYPWLERPPEQGFPYHGDDRPIRRDYLVDDYLGDVGDVRLVGSVHIENGAADPRAETTWLVGLMRSSRVPSALVAKVDLLTSSAHADLEWQAGQPGVRGIRQILSWHADPTYSHTSRNDIIEDPVWRSNFAHLNTLGLSFDLQVYPHQLMQAAELAATFPDTSLVLDHAGMPIHRDRDYLDSWHREMERLADHDNVVCKVSAIGTQDHRWTVESLRPVVLGAIEAFGPDRTMFASNFPVDGLYSSYRRLYDAFDQLTSNFSQDERSRLFARTAAEVYRLDLRGNEETTGARRA